MEKSNRVLVVGDDSSSEYISLLKEAGASIDVVGSREQAEEAWHSATMIW